MKIRFKKIKFKNKLNFKPILKYLLFILVTAIIITLTLIALPLTEKVSEKVTFNLNTKDSQYWSKEYVAFVGTTDKKELQKVKEIIYRRLRNFGVERVAIYTESDNDESSRIRIIVNTTKDPDLVSQLATSRYSYKIVTRREDVDFDKEDDPYVVVFGTNYNATDWDYNDFRTVYIPKNKFRTTDGNYRYFAVFKPWPNKQAEFTKFLKEHESEYMGVEIDFFVTPFEVQEIPEGTTAQQTITLGVYADTEEEAKAISLLYNSGHIEANFNHESETDREPDVISLDYIKVSIGLVISLVTAYIYLLLFKHSTKESLLRSFFATGLTIIIYLAYLKLTHIPVDTFLLAIQFILIMIFIRAIAENRDSEIFLVIGSIVVLAIVSLLGTSLMVIFAQGMIALIALAKISLLFSNWYIDNVKKI